MFSLIYLSSAVVPFTLQELKDLLVKSREKNAHLQITGMLLYKDGNFMQLLEGDEQVVHSLYTAIWGDPRHRNVNILAEMHDDKRQFPAWSMGFQNLDAKEAADLPGYTPFLDTPLDQTKFPNVEAAQKLFRIFKTT